MNRNYLPPALKMHSTNVGPNSPPTVASSSSSSAHSGARRMGVRTYSKLPTVSEVGKLLSFVFSFFIYFTLATLDVVVCRC